MNRFTKAFEKYSVGILAWSECIGVLFILLAALFFQFYLNEIPCPLCLLQRLGILLIALPLLMNLRYKRKIAHYILANLAALLTAGIAARQVLLHINDPVGQGYGDLFLGYHLYTWVFIISLIIIIYNSVMACISEQYYHSSLYFHGKIGKYMVNIALTMFIGIAVVNAIGIYFECGFSQCPDNPVHYKLLMR